MFGLLAIAQSMPPSSEASIEQACETAVTVIHRVLEYIVPHRPQDPRFCWNFIQSYKVFETSRICIR